jgi:hypothetical protein
MGTEFPVRSGEWTPTSRFTRNQNHLSEKGATILTQPISAYAQHDATVDYREQKQKNSIPKSTKAFRQHVEQRVAQFLQEVHDYPLSKEQVADTYDHMYVATYNELRRTETPGGVTITKLRAILKQQGLGARKIEGSRYAITSNGDPLFSLDLSKLRDTQHARDRIHQELAYKE